MGLEVKRMVKEKNLNNKDDRVSTWGGIMKKQTRKLLLSALGGALITIGILSFYNMLMDSVFFGIPAIIFILVGSFALKKAFE